jgi:hypothetical protein
MPGFPFVECVHEQLGSTVCIAPVRLAVTWLLRIPLLYGEDLESGMKSVSIIDMDMAMVISG